MYIFSSLFWHFRNLSYLCNVYAKNKYITIEIMGIFYAHLKACICKDIRLSLH